jgi:signal transduction histidine kinase
VFKGSLDLLEQTQDRPAFEAAALARMRKAVNEMQALLETLLLLARGEELDAQTEDVAVADVIAEQMDAVREAAQRKDVTLEIEAVSPCIVKAPRKVLEILLGNLLRNAVNYTEHGRVRAIIHEQSVQIEDTGVGMGPEDLDKVFEAFYRGEKSRHVAPGHGLGLAIVKRLADRYHWHIGAVSALGEGTRFEVRFSD